VDEILAFRELTTVGKGAVNRKIVG